MMEAMLSGPRAFGCVCPLYCLINFALGVVLTGLGIRLTMHFLVLSLHALCQVVIVQ